MSFKLETQQKILNSTLTCKMSIESENKLTMYHDAVKEASFCVDRGIYSLEHVIRDINYRF